MAETLAGRTVVVTGAASGIGYGTAAELAARGASLVLWDIDGPAVASIADTLRQSGTRCYGLAVDVSNDAQVASAMQRSVELLGTIDGAFNNAGIGARRCRSTASTTPRSTTSSRSISRVSGCA